MDHHQEAGAGGTVEGYEDKYYYGRRANGIYIPRFRNLFDDKRDYLRGFGYQGGAGREGYDHQVAEYSIGKEYKEALTEPGPWSMNIVGFGETLPYHDNQVKLDRTRKDKWGLNILAIDAEMKSNELKMRKDMEQDAKEMLEAVGVKNIHSFNSAPFLGRSIHEMGIARMGRDPRTSVLNSWNQVWDATNIFVTDGSFMTSANCVNPSLTYMAMTARAADHAVSELKKGNI
jgi:choline dehydrogenase-like flavoprotein